MQPEAPWIHEPDEAVRAGDAFATAEVGDIGRLLKPSSITPEEARKFCDNLHASICKALEEGRRVSIYQQGKTEPIYSGPGAGMLIDYQYTGAEYCIGFDSMANPRESF